jgi:hypothetical protein
MDTDQRRLLACFAKLGAADRDTLLAFADFLAARTPDDGDATATAPQQPKKIPRPRKESVVAAIRRLTETYYMLERKDMFSDTASLMGAHVMHGRSARDIVDELERAFARQYERYLEGWRE